MTLFRLFVTMLGGLAIVLAVVILRAETTRLHYEVSQREREAEELRLALRECELQLARERNPMVIRQRVAEVLRQLAGAPAESERSASPERPGPAPRRRGRR